MRFGALMPPPANDDQVFSDRTLPETAGRSDSELPLPSLGGGLIDTSKQRQHDKKIIEFGFHKEFRIQFAHRVRTVRQQLVSLLLNSQP